MYKKRRNKIKQVVSGLRKGGKLFNVLVECKVGRSTWDRWEKEKPRLERLRRAAEEYKDTNELIEVESAWIKRLKGGKAHPIEYIFYFTNRDPARWKDKRAVPSAVALTKVDVNNGAIPDAELNELKNQQSALLGRLAEKFNI